MQLGLGTAQFGSAYGVSNQRGQVSRREIAALLELAQAEGVRVLDTAAVYGESEAALGACLKPGHSFRIVTKTVPVAAARVENDDVRQVAAAFERSLERLRTDRVDALLVHNAAALARPGGALLAEWLTQIRKSGRATKVGFSCYTPEELAAARSVLAPDIVQLPCSVVDRRFLASGACEALKASGVEIHVRSLFLQGALLMPQDALPPSLTPYRAVFDAIDARARNHGLSRLALALAFVAEQPELDVAIVGVTGSDELREILAATRAASAQSIDFAGLASTDEKLVNPSLWSATPSLAQSAS